MPLPVFQKMYSQSHESCLGIKAIQELDECVSTLLL